MILRYHSRSICCLIPHLERSDISISWTSDISIPYITHFYVVALCLSLDFIFGLEFTKADMRQFTLKQVNEQLLDTCGSVLESRDFI